MSDQSGERKSFAFNKTVLVAMIALLVVIAAVYVFFAITKQSHPPAQVPAHNTRLVLPLPSSIAT